jgi:hypothetical protein
MGSSYITTGGEIGPIVAVSGRQGHRRHLTPARTPWRIRSVELHRDAPAPGWGRFACPDRSPQSRVSGTSLRNVGSGMVPASGSKWVSHDDSQIGSAKSEG